MLSREERAYYEEIIETLREIRRILKEDNDKYKHYEEKYIIPELENTMKDLEKIKIRVDEK